jgi:ribosomal protein S12
MEAHAISLSLKVVTAKSPKTASSKGIDFKLSRRHKKATTYISSQDKRDADTNISSNSYIVLLDRRLGLKHLFY